jgi:D-alanine-D-alanine ligase
MKIALVLNTRREDDEFQVEFDPPHTIGLIRHGIEAAGHEYAFVEADEDVARNLKDLRPDLAFNRAEGLRGESRESHVPAALEMLGIPYIGSGPRSLAVCLDKAWAKVFVAAKGVDTPAFDVVDSMERAEACDPVFPVILKPNAEGSSIGINADNVVSDRPAFLAKTERMLLQYGQPILAEEFVPGREVSVGLLGKPGGPPEVFPLLEVDFSRMPVSVGNVFGQVAKTAYDDLDNYVCPAALDAGLAEAVRRAALGAWDALELRDFARMDFRIDAARRPRFLEVNPLPGMDYDPDDKDFSFYTLMAFRAGYDYDGLVAALIESALSRVVR